MSSPTNTSSSSSNTSAGGGTNSLLPPSGAKIHHAVTRKVVSNASILIMFAIGLLTTMLAPILVGNVIYVLARIVVPSTTLPGTFMRTFHVSAITFLSFGICFNFIMACATHPGNIPKVYLDACKWYLDKHPNETLRECFHCQVPKAPRSHHCSMCGECVLKMDHHCVWHNQCIGYHNYRYFFGFLFWLLVGTIYSALSCAHMLWFHSAPYHHAFVKVATDTNQVFFIFVLTVAIALTMGLYVGFNMYEIYNNQSAVEVHISKEIASEGHVFKNPYNLGPLKNAIECLGPETLQDVLPRWVFSKTSSPSSSSSSSSLFLSSVTSWAAVPIRLFLLVLPNIQLYPHEGVWFPTNAASSSSV